MLKTVFANRGGAATQGERDSLLPGVSDELKKHVRDYFPTLLDGALVPLRQDMGRHALRMLSNLGRRSADSPDAAKLRQTLDSLSARPRPRTCAGLIPVTPRRMRVWWDNELLNLDDDVMASASRPRPVLRFYDTTGLPAGSSQWNQVFDVDAELAESGKTVDFWAADRSYLVELGLLHADGRFQMLARTNHASLPRENPGEPGGEWARTCLDLDVAGDDAFLIPDAEALEWFVSGRDWPERDRRAELALRMLYKAFLREGPRVLRRLDTLTRGEKAELERQFLARRRKAARMAGDAARRDNGRRAGPSTRVMVALLDTCPGVVSESNRYPLALFARPSWSVGGIDSTGFGYYQTLLAASRSVADRALAHVRGKVAEALSLLSAPSVAAEAAPESDSGISHLVRTVPADLGEPFAWKAASIFETARELGRGLSRMSPASDGNEASGRESLSVGFSANVGGAEGRRFAKAGVKLSRMALSLEGQARPGARFKVAGKYVTADRDGCFRVECVLSGKNIRIPMQVDNGRTGLARGLLKVEWAKTGARREKTRI